MPITPFSAPSKLPKVGQTIFTTMSAMAQQEGALNLSQGFPNFDTSVDLIDLVSKHMKRGTNQYAPMAGTLALREVLARNLQNQQGTTYNPETEITITAGATQAIFTAIMALVQEDDEVILFTPAYDCYAPAVELAGGKPVYFQLHGPDYKVNWAAAQKLMNHRTKMILLNTPHNPTGSVLGEDCWLELEKMTKDSEVIVLSDEVYEYMVFDGKRHYSAAAFPELAKRSLVVGSFGKTFHATGWKTGYIAGPAELMKEFRKVHQYNVFCTNHPVQLALAEFLSDPKNFEEVHALYEGKRDLFLSGIDNEALRWKPTEGSFFQLIDFSGLTDMKDTELAVHLTKKFKLASIPISVFYQDEFDQTMLRFCFAKDDATLIEAGKILSSIQAI